MKRFISVLTHVDALGKARMVDVSHKSATLRKASASAIVDVGPTILKSIQDNVNKKGDVLTVSKIAGIQAAKNTSQLIPLCHTIHINQVDLVYKILEPNKVRIDSTVIASDATGVEMEALTAVSVASLTIYDMVKAMSKDVKIEQIQLESKSGGKSGDFQRN